MSSRLDDPHPARTARPSGGSPRRGSRLIGRQAQIAAVEAELTAVPQGSLRVVLIAGGAGLGKTRLAAEVLEQRADQALCLSARSYRWGTAASFGPWVEALDRHLRDLPETQLRALCGTSLHDLAALLKTVEAVAGILESEPPRWRLLEALVDLFDRLSADRPVLVLLDDLHLADTSSWEALRYLARRLSGAPIGIIATARPEALERHPIAGEVLLGLEEDGMLLRMALETLRRTEIAELAHDLLRAHPASRSSFVPEPLVTWLAERSVGHPLFIIGLLEALVDEGADLAAPQLERIPETLRERVSLDLRALPPDTRSVLETLAVVDGRIDLSDLRRVVDLPPDDLAAALEELARARLVAEHGDRAALAYETVHPIVGDTVYGSIGGARRRALHRRAARALLESGRLGSAAGHYARAAEPGDDEAVDALCRAVQQAEARGLYQEALATLSALLDILPAGDRRWLRVLDAMRWQPEWVLSHLAEGDAAIAIEAMERISSHLGADADPAARATVDLHLAAFLSFGAGRLAEAEQACQRAIVDFAEAGDHERALLARNELAWIRGCGDDLDEQAERAAAVLEDALRAGHQRAAIQAAGTAAYALGCTGSFGEAEALYQRSIELAEEAGDTYRVTWARAQRGLMHGLAGKLDEAIACIEHTLRDDPDAPDAIAFEDLAHCHWLAGRLTESVAAIEQSAARRPVRGSRRRAWAAALGARLYAEMGLRGKADSGLEHSRVTYETGHILTWSCWYDWTSGFLAWHDGDSRTALEALGRAAERLRAVGAQAYEALVRSDIAEVSAAAGQREVCDATAARLAEIAEHVDSPLHAGLAGLAAARSDLAGGSPQAAASAAEQAAEGLAAAGYALHAATASELAGQALSATDRAAAVERLSAAVAAFEHCGAVWRRDAARARLGQLGSRGRRSAAALQGREALSPRELEVARLAARGYTAKEAGEQLYIGRRTVESHLASAYQKLGVASKRELIRRAAELELMGEPP